MQKSLLKVTLIAIAIMFFQKTSRAQSYDTGIGVRFGGYENGLTVKHFIQSNTAVEGILGLRPGVFVLTLLYEKHAEAFSESSLKWYYGFGGHVGGIGRDRYYRSYTNDRYYNKNGVLLGADAILGLEWVVPELPISVGADIHPRLELLNGAFIDIEPALSIRYTF